MNVTEFAEQIVFGTTLADKLLVPGRLTDNDRNAGPKVCSLVAPGRPTFLKMTGSSGTNTQPPSDESLENEKARGQLLHFLANHELLATELMALVLLKFPDAPHAFRRGVLVTLQEEQEHTRMYIRRMKECGVEFGTYPLSGQFWRIVEPMESPMDFVSRLSLTFEQANLDYSLHFAKLFRNLGDQKTADVLQKIYEDEISHVQHGLHWFRQWKNPEHSDWEAYQESLDFPMSPQRGRGPRGAFNRAGRIQAGLTESFVDAIEVFRQSRGRAPTVRWFDPAAESEIAGDHSDRTIQLMKQIGLDLELVIVPMSKQDDVVLCRRLPSREILKHLIESGFDLPEFALFDDRNSLANRKLNEFEPWAWTPNNIELTHPLSESTRKKPQRWNEEKTDLFRKSWSTEKLKDWLSQNQPDAPATPDFFTSADCVGMPICDAGEVAAALDELHQRGWSKALFKQDISASGRGQRRLDCNELATIDSQWLGAFFDSTSSKAGDVLAVVEPRLDRVVDLSFLWYFQNGEPKPRFLGWTRPLVAPGRRFIGTRLTNPFSDCEQDLKRFLLADRSANLQLVSDWIEYHLTPELVSRNFSGFFGVDALVCRDKNQTLKIKPVVELNPRMTMGHVAINLKKRIAPGVKAEFRILTRPNWEQVSAILKKFPLKKTRDGRWESGLVKLGEFNEQTKLIPLVLMGECLASFLKAVE